MMLNISVLAEEFEILDGNISRCRNFNAEGIEVVEAGEIMAAD